MIPRAASPALASPCAAGVSDALLALLPARGIVVRRMGAITAQQYRGHSCGFAAGRLPTVRNRQPPTHPGLPDRAKTAFAIRVTGHLRVLTVVIANWRTGAGATLHRHQVRRPLDLDRPAPAGDPDVHLAASRIRQDGARPVWVVYNRRVSEGGLGMRGTAVWEGVERQGLRRRNQQMERAQPGQRPDPSQPAGTDR